MKERVGWMEGWREKLFLKNDVNMDLMMRSLETENERNSSHERTKSHNLSPYELTFQAATIAE